MIGARSVDTDGDSAARGREFLSTPTEHERSDEFGEADGAVEDFLSVNNPEHPSMAVHKACVCNGPRVE